MSEGKLKERAQSIRRIYDDTPCLDSSGKVNPLWDMEKFVSVKILDEAKANFPFKIYKDNDELGENDKPTFSFYIKNSSNPDQSFPVENLLDVEREISLWFKEWFGNDLNTKKQISAPSLERRGDKK